LRGREKEKPYFSEETFFSEEKKAKDFLEGQGKEKAYSKTLLPQKPPGTDGRLFPFARESAFISSLGSKNARYAPGVFRFERPSAEGSSLASLPEGPNPQKVLRTFPGTPPGRWRGLPRRKEFFSLLFLLRYPFLA
jgi:hypothetical protein